MVVVPKPDIGAVQPKRQHSAILRDRFNGVWRAWVPAAIRPVPPDPLSKAFESARTDSLRIRPKLYLVEVGCGVDGQPAGFGSRSTPRNAANQVAAYQGTDLLQPFVIANPRSRRHGHLPESGVAGISKTHKVSRRNRVQSAILQHGAADDQISGRVVSKDAEACQTAVGLGASILAGVVCIGSCQNLPDDCAGSGTADEKIALPQQFVQHRLQFAGCGLLLREIFGPKKVSMLQECNVGMAALTHATSGRRSRSVLSHSVQRFPDCVPPWHRRSHRRASAGLCSCAAEAERSFGENDCLHSS